MGQRGQKVRLESGPDEEPIAVKIVAERLRAKQIDWVLVNQV